MSTKTETTKIPTDVKPLVRDPDLAAAIEKELKPLSGEKLQLAQDAVRKLRESGLMGTFSQVVDAYKAAIREAVQAAGK